MESPLLQCTGRESCYDADITSPQVICGATGACAQGNFVTSPDGVTSVEVSSYRGAESAYFDMVPFIDATGCESLYQAVIMSRGIPEMAVVLRGRHAGNLATITCLGL